ncbi:MAG: sigma-70 family RNA polymerase sigma factor [Planctomycetales bacterium]|nr:sigma-70 family RNA polymerase sigma factor [Planctomycetales bacterium]
MALSDVDRRLLERCLSGGPRAWEDFVDRFMGLVVHVVNHSAESRSIRLSAADRDDLISEVFLAIVQNDFGVLRRFRGQSSLATYLTVVARRVVVHKMLSELSGEASSSSQVLAMAAAGASAEQRINDRDEVEHLLTQLQGQEADVVRMYHLEGMSYQDISRSTGMPENSVGPLLSRARTKMRRV